MTTWYLFNRGKRYHRVNKTMQTYHAPLASFCGHVGYRNDTVIDTIQVEEGKRPSDGCLTCWTEGPVGNPE